MRPGDTLLELAAGAGSSGFDLTSSLSPEVRLISTDVVPEMVEAARRRGAQLGRGNAEFRVMDAERIDLDDDAVDRVLCESGYMLVADPATALAETRRVLRPGGRLALSVWGPPGLNPWDATPASILVERGHLARPEAWSAGSASLTSEEELRTLLSSTGFGGSSPTRSRSDSASPILTSGSVGRSTSIPSGRP